MPELCHLTGMSDDMRSDYRLMKTVSQHTRPTPTERAAAVRKFVADIKGEMEEGKSDRLVVCLMF